MKMLPAMQLKGLKKIAVVSGTLLVLEGALSPSLALADSQSVALFRLDADSNSMSQVKIVDQGNFGDCFANSAVQMIDAFRFSHGDHRTDFHSSAIALAADTNITKSHGSLDSGQICQAVETAREGGVCNDAPWVLKNGEVPENYFWKYATWQTNLQHQPAPPSASKNIVENIWEAFLQAGTESSQAQQYAYQMEQELSEGGLSHDQMPSLPLLEVILLGQGSADLVSSFKPAACGAGNTLHPALGSCQVYWPPIAASPPAHAPSNWQELDLAHAQDVQNRIYALLSMPNAQPVGIQFCSSVLELGSSFDSMVTVMSSGYSSCDRHAALLIGYRANPTTHKIDFLLRNSWGKVCSIYSKDWECETDKGTLWIDAEQLSKNIFGIFWISQG